MARSTFSVLPVKLNAQAQQEFWGNAAYAGGGRCAAVLGKVVPLDLPTLAAPMELASKRRMSLAAAAEAVRAHDDLFRDLVIAVEDAGLKPRSRDDQLFFIAIQTDAGSTLADGGRVDDALPRIAARVSLLELARVSAFSVDELLIGIRTRAAEAGVELPARLTLPKNHPEHAAWIESLRERRRLADARWKAGKGAQGPRRR